MAELDPRIWQRSEDGEYWEMRPEIKPLYKAALDKQLEEWVKGNNVHTTNLPPGMESECCPDMSCCNPKNAWSLEKRQKFVEADEESRHAMMMGALYELFNEIHGSTEEPKVYLAGQLPGKDDTVH